MPRSDCVFLTTEESARPLSPSWCTSILKSGESELHVKRRRHRVPSYGHRGLGDVCQSFLGLCVHIRFGGMCSNKTSIGDFKVIQGRNEENKTLKANTIYWNATLCLNILKPGRLDPQFSVMLFEYQWGGGFGGKQPWLSGEGVSASRSKDLMSMFRKNQTPRILYWECVQVWPDRVSYCALPCGEGGRAGSVGTCSSVPVPSSAAWHTKRQVCWARGSRSPVPAWSAIGQCSMETKAPCAAALEISETFCYLYLTDVSEGLNLAFCPGQQYRSSREMVAEHFNDGHYRKSCTGTFLSFQDDFSE